LQYSEEKFLGNISQGGNRMQCTENMLNNIMNDIAKNPKVSLEQIPNIDLYMDQVTTFSEEVLSSYKRNENDKILTKTMINNYTKDKILPPPIKKKYTKRHIILLILTYHLKSILPIQDIKILLGQLCNYDDKTVEALYTAFLEMQSSTQSSFDKTLFQLDSKLNNDELELILVVLNLVLQANYRKQIAEKIIDTVIRPTKNKE